MRCPFPGMDPYLERPEIWPDFHDRLITYLGESLQGMLRPRYVTLTQHRLYVVERDRPIWPDVSLVKSPRAAQGAQGAIVALAPDKPVVIDFHREELRQTLLTILDPAAGNRVVTAIEVLSPDNKVPGPGRDSYRQKREELWAAGANLIEIDLLRSGRPTVRVSKEHLDKLEAWRYLVAVTRTQPSRHELYPFRLADRLPRVSIPLDPKDLDVVLDLQLPFEKCWDAGPYPEILRYEGTPPGSLTADELDWARRRTQGT